MARLGEKPEAKETARMSKQFDKLVVLLKELFQLDQPDLDFGLYRIMHAKADEITQFLEQDLLPQVQDAFSQYRTADKAVLEDQLNKAIEQANNLGVDPETSPKVKKLQQKIADESVDVAALEAEVYDHLYSFFRRYYDEGDFLAKRVYKPGVYAVPYEGEEVKLHWANRDQYYIKTSEYLRDYTFTLRPSAAKDPMRVHFRLADAAESEHGNVKAAEGKDRVFILAAEDFAGVENGELVLRFQYRPARVEDWPEESRQAATAAAAEKPPAQKELTTDAVRRVLALSDPSLKLWIDELSRKHVKANGEIADYTRLEGHLDRYVKRHTFDYFIHKDLGGFLRRELDFFIKNEIMHLDDVESESAPRAEQYISKIKVVRSLAHKLIAFLEQLEDFQKTLWLKKKLVVETSYCIRLSIIPEEFYPEIAANETQREEWVRLCAIDEIQGAPDNAGYSVPLTSEFLKANPTLMMDTRHYAQDCAARILNTIADLNTITDGELFHGENFQALSLVQPKYQKRVACVYIDPPFNTGKDDFPYKDNYQHSSWLSMMFDRANLARSLMTDNGVFSVQIGDEESSRLRALLDEVFAERKNSSVVRRGIKNVQAQFADIDRLTVGHDIIHSYCRRRDVRLRHLRQSLEDEKPGKWDTFWRGTNRPTMRYELFGNRPETGQWRWEERRAKRASANYKYFLTNEANHKTLDEWYAENLQAGIDLDFVRLNEGGVVQYYVPPQGFRLVSDNWLDIPASGSVTDFTHEKSVVLLQRLISWSTEEGDYVLDYFAGSGSSGQAAFSMPAYVGGRRKFLLMEIGAYFDDVLLPRLKKVAYTPEWKDGKPKRFATAEEAERSPRIMKVIRLESYEDTLNNLELRRTKEQRGLLELAQAQGADRLREQYLLRYMLDIETGGSQSLLNVAAFSDPTAYRLKVKVPGSDETRDVNVDLLETFNYLIGLTVKHIAVPQVFRAAFYRDEEQRLRLDGRLKQDEAGPWWFRTVDGVMPDGRTALVIWRKLTGEAEQDNLVLDEWFTRQGYSTKDYEFDLLFVNGDNNLENLRQGEETWKVRLIEEDFHRLMFDVESV